MTTQTMDPEKWKARARWKLAGHGVGKQLADTVLAEVDQHCAASGEDPATAFGEPDAFAATVLRERAPTARRAELDHFGMTAGERRSEVIAQLGVLVTLAGIVGWISKGLLLPLTTAGLAGTLLLTAAVLAMLYAVHELPASGRRPRAMVATAGAVVVFGALAALAFTGLPRTGLGRLPTPIVTVAGIALLAGALTRKTTSKPLSAPADDEQWLTQLRSLLVGRHHVSRARAEELTAEAAAQLRETGASPVEEFGPADEYAVVLAEHEQR